MLEGLQDDSLMDPVSILTLVTFGVTTSASLYKAIDNIKSRKQDVRNLKAEVGNLNIVLQALAKNIEETTENFEVLRLILDQCSQACQSFEKEVLDHVKKSESRVENAKAWTKLQFAGSEIDNFRNLIGSYKATMTIAMADANLRTVKITKQLLEKYTEMTEDATSDLQDQIADLSHKLDVLRQETPVMSPGDLSHVEEPNPVATQQTLEQKASLEQCLVVCRQLLAHIEEAKHAIRQESASMASTVDGARTPTGIDGLAPRLTADALQMCTHNMNAAARHLQDIREAKTSADFDVSQIMQQLDSARQCLDIVNQAQQHRVNVYEDIETGEDSFQTVVSTIGDLIRAKGLRIGGRSVNIMGQMHDDSLQKITSELRVNLAERPECENVKFEKRHGFGYTIRPKGT